MSDRILIIDDDVLSHRLIKEGLKDAGFSDIEPIFAATGETGIEMCLKYTPMIVLLDMHLPDMSGLDVARRLLRIDPETNIFLLTSYISEPETIKTIELGARGFISKNETYISTVIGLIVGLIKILGK